MKICLHQIKMCYAVMYLFAVDGHVAPLIIGASTSTSAIILSTSLARLSIPIVSVFFFYFKTFLSTIIFSSF